MNKVIVAFESESNRTRIGEMLEAGGIKVGFTCRSGSDVIRCVRKMNGGIVVCGYKLAEMTAADLAADLGDMGMLLIVASAVQLMACESDNIFKLPAPVSKSDLIASVRMLMQLDEKHVRLSQPKRSDKENADILYAKELLISKNGMSEPEAHRFIQRKSMDSGKKAIEVARLIIESYS